jgi:NitT/TauT family transport system ATP-binding protein
MSNISITSVSHAFPAGKSTLEVLQDISLNVDSREVLAVLGPSGSGKSTLLKCVAGLIRPTIGTVRIDSQPPDKLLSAGKVGFAFQEPTLLPWRTVEQNILLVWELKRETNANARQRVEEMLQLVGLTQFRDFYPHQLSGGMKQRAGLARSMILDPEILLLDEPLASLDLITRTQLMLELSSMFEEMKVPIIVVTHSVEEAVLWGTKIIILSPRPARVIEELIHPRSTRRDLAYMETSQFQHLAAKCREIMFNHNGNK